jgi:hypothetical protein
MLIAAVMSHPDNLSVSGEEEFWHRKMINCRYPSTLLCLTCWIVNMTTEADAVKCVISGYEFTTIHIIVSQSGSNSTHIQLPSVTCI